MSGQIVEKKNTLVKKEELRKRYMPFVDIYETPENFVMLVDLPGVHKDHLDVTIEKNELRIFGAVNAPKLDGFKRVYGDAEVGDYERRFKLSDQVDRDNIEARLKDGVLTLTLQKASQARKRSISITAD